MAFASITDVRLVPDNPSGWLGGAGCSNETTISWVSNDHETRPHRRQSMERGMRVLIADRDHAFLEVAQRYLSRQGHEVKTATNGLESVALLHHDVPDVVVLQRELLWGGGDGVVALMQQLSEWSKIPVILTSDGGIPEESCLITCPQLVAQLQKPYRLEDLSVHLQECIPDRAEIDATGSNQ
jgi:DNA-binding NtrC family response regulator